MLYASAATLGNHGLTEADRTPAVLLAAPPTHMLVSVEEMHAAFWQRSTWGQAILLQLEKQPFDRSKGPPGAVQTTAFGTSWKTMLGAVVRRQVTLNLRMKGFYIARTVQTIIMALIISSLFATIQPTVDDGRNAVRRGESCSLTCPSACNCPW